MVKKICSWFWDMSHIEEWCIDTSSALFKSIFKRHRGMKFTAVVCAIASLWAFVISRRPIKPFGPEVDLSGYELVFEDEFDGDELDMKKWRHRGSTEREGGYYALDTVSVEDGNLHIRAKYLEDGSKGEGWYTGCIRLLKEYKYGYFECRCKVNDKAGFWSAFWLQHNDSSKKESAGGVHGCEIDIMESCAMNTKMIKDKNCILQCTHVNGGTGDTTDDVDTSGAIFFKPEKDIYTEYNTYGLKWTEDEYIFYVNGIESWRSSWRDGASQEAEEVILSLTLPRSDLAKKPKTLVQDFCIDYVKIYQEK